MAPFHGNPDNLDRATLDLLDRAFTDVWSHFRSKQSSNISVAGEQAIMRERVRELAATDSFLLLKPLPQTPVSMTFTILRIDLAGLPSCHGNRATVYRRAVEAK